MGITVLPREPSLGELLGRGIGGGLAGGLQQQMDLAGKLALQREKKPITFGKEGEFEGLLKRFGYSEDEANRLAALYSSLTTGGQTQFANMLIDRLMRRDTNEPTTPRADVEEQDMPESKFPEITPFEGLTPKEKVARQKEHYTTNSKAFSENATKLNNFKSEARTIGQLTNLNDNYKLPRGIGRIIKVNLKTGDLRIPATASPQEQLFGKTINEFLKKARDSFGARVTNFELDKFLQGIPTLANTEEGRRLILEQMKNVNELNQLHEDSLKEVYTHYGLRNVSPEQVGKVAEKLRSIKEKDLTELFYEAPRAQEKHIARKNLPENHVLMLFNGEYIYVPKGQVEKALAQGAKLR